MNIEDCCRWRGNAFLEKPSSKLPFLDLVSFTAEAKSPSRRKFWQAATEERCKHHDAVGTTKKRGSTGGFRRRARNKRERLPRKWNAERFKNAIPLSVKKKRRAIRFNLRLRKKQIKKKNGE